MRMRFILAFIAFLGAFGAKVAVAAAAALFVTGHGAGAAAPWVFAGALLLVTVGLVDDIVRTRVPMDRRSAAAIACCGERPTGHDGSLTTIHANSARDALYRLDTMVAMAEPR